MIKVDKHLVTCRCADCEAMFPGDRYEVTWPTPPPPASRGRIRRAHGHVPIGAPGAGWGFAVWIDDDHRLVGDWPGFPGTDGAGVEVVEGPDGTATITATADPALRALAHPVPLRRRAIGRFNARCMVDYGLADASAADYIACDVHGHGLPALTCRCVAAAVEPISIAVLYDVDGDYPDALCLRCLERYAGGDVSVCVTVCSRCQRRHLLRHAIAESGWYGGPQSPS